MAAAARISVEENNPAFQKELGRYYRHLFLNRRLFLREPDFLKTYFHVGASYAKILKVARWMAAADGQPAAFPIHVRPSQPQKLARNT